MSTQTATNVTDRVRNYEGNIQFLLSLKESLRRWGALTPKQLEAAHSCLNSQAKTINMENTSEEIKTILAYVGENSFVKDIAHQFKNFGTLTSRQIDAALRQIEREEDKRKRLRMNWPTPGETILLRRIKGKELKEKYNLQFIPMLIDITRLKSITPKAILFTGKMTVKRGKVCTSCLKTLTDEFSMLTGMGKICADNWKIPYIKDASEVERFREDYLRRVEEIGEMEFWVPKSQIKKWEGSTERILRAI